MLRGVRAPGTPPLCPRLQVLRDAARRLDLEQARIVDREGIRLAKHAPVVLVGDLYHYPEERATGRTPTFEFNAEQSAASRKKVEAFAKQNKAEIWIEHDIATHAKLPKAPAFVE